MHFLRNFRYSMLLPMFVARRFKLKAVFEIHWTNPNESKFQL